MKLALIQNACGACHRWQPFFDQVTKALGEGAQVVVLPELFLHPYFCQTESPAFFQEAMDLENPHLQKIRNLSEKYGAVIVVPYFEKDAQNRYFNSCGVFESGKLLGHYRKMHIPQDPGFYEKYYFAEGDLGYQVFATKFGKIGVLICFDQWFPEASRALTLMGCDIIVIPTAIGWDDREAEGKTPEAVQSLKAEQLDAWITVQRGHAIANGVHLAAVNRVGREGSLEFWGNSFVSGPLGATLGHLGPTEEKNLLVECSLTENNQVREVWTFLRDRRPDSYNSLIQPRRQL